ncbi:MAG: transcriptional regulator GcvA [Alphaproteobacteria bacterium]
MTSNLPSPVALRAFEAAARHLSFTRAAAELNVTQAAVSHQIKALESHLGVRLFHRLTRRLTLTDEGDTLYSVVGDAYQRIAGAIDRLRVADSGGTLSVSLEPFIAAAWLSPRIGRFWQRHPNIELHLHHTAEPVDFRQSGIDLAVVWGADADVWPGLTAELLLRVRVTPVCSPRLLEGPHPLRVPDDLRHHTLLQDVGHQGWRRWLAAAGATKVPTDVGPVIDDHNVAMHAAMEGQGVVLGESSFIAHDIAARRLVRPFKLDVGIEAAYHILYPADALARPKVRAFRDWLLEEVATGDADSNAA